MHPVSAHEHLPKSSVHPSPDPWLRDLCGVQVSDQDVREHFSRWGDILDVYFPGKHRGQRANYCFVTFRAEEDSQAACAQSARNIHGHVCPCTLPLHSKTL